MADTKSTNLNAGPALVLADLFVVVDVSDPTMSVAGSNVKSTGQDVVDLVSSPVRLQSINARVAAYTLVLTDSFKLVTVDIAAEGDLTIPLFASVAWATGTKIDVIQLGNGSIRFLPSGGTASYKTRTLGSRALMQYLGSDVWHISGDLAVVV